MALPPAVQRHLGICHLAIGPCMLASMTEREKATSHRNGSWEEEVRMGFAATQRLRPIHAGQHDRGRRWEEEARKMRLRL